jgi:hypothetical protein
MLKKLGLGSLAIVGVLAASVAIAGLWNNFPKVGSARYCITTVNGVCQQYVPAGPATLTGNETIPADTNLSNGAMPQTVLIPSSLIGGYSSVLSTGATQSVTMADNVTNVILSHSTTITSAYVVAPANPINGQRVKIAADHTVTTFTFFPNTGQTLSVATPTVITASTTVPQGYEFIYYNTIWYRMQ